MSELRYEAYTIQAADFEEESSLPSLGELGNVQQRARAELDEDDEVFVGYGFLRGCFPYRQQERYGRELRERSFDGYVLENEFLRAWFLPGLGGRLISLFDKEAGRELLFHNDVLRVGNLALRSAWFSGGVEWNASIIGHSPFPCAPLFAARTSLPDGTPVLRMYEYERRRGVTYQMDFFLPDGSRVLFARMRLVNENEEVVPTYWWSNIAVPEREDSRVVIPADEAYVDRGEGVRKEPVPVDATGADVTYPVRNPKAIDHFWKLRRGARPYIAHLDGEGYGLAQTSTSRLRGRKLFVWGHTAGGRRWQEFLSGAPDKRYVEIQAGLAQTQYECVPMPPRTAWEWLEAYGPMHADPRAVHGAWEDAQREVEAQLDAWCSREALEELLASTRDSLARRPAQALLQQGSGWGALENRRRAHRGERGLSPHLDFGECGAGQAQWALLLETGTLGHHDPREAPPSWCWGEDWLRLLEEAARGAGGNDWYVHLQLGVTQFAAGRLPEAKRALLRSCSLAPNAWASYALSRLFLAEGDREAVRRAALTALSLCPDDPCAAPRCLGCLSEAGAFADVLSSFERLSPAIAALPRVRLHRIRALIETGRPEEALEDLTRDGGLVVPDVREGEETTSALWILLWSRLLGVSEEEAERRKPVPAVFDFRMQG